MHTSGVKVSFYWANFPSEYLKTIRLGSLSDLKHLERITLHHSEPRSMLDPVQWNQFLEEFASIIRCVAEGYGKVGYLRRDKETAIHKDLNRPEAKDMYSATENEDSYSETSDEASVKSDDDET